MGTGTTKGGLISTAADPTASDAAEDFVRELVRGEARRAQLPSVINVPDGAYLSVALVAMAALIAHAWSPAYTPLWLVAGTWGILLAGFTMKGIFGALMLYEGWLRWRQQRKDGGRP